MEDSDGEFLPDYYLLKNSKRKSKLVASSSVGAGVCVIPAFGVESSESGKAEEKHEDHCHSKKMKTGSIEKGKTKPNCCLDCLQRLDDPNLKVTLYQNDMVNWYFIVFFFNSFTPVHH